MLCQSALSTTGSGLGLSSTYSLAHQYVVGWSIGGTCAGTFVSQRRVDTKRRSTSVSCLFAQRYGGTSDHYFKAPFYPSLVGVKS